MTSEDVSRAIFTANDIALQWYAVTHDQPIPGAPGTIVMSSGPGGLGATFGAGTLVLAGIAIIGLVLVFRR